MSLLDPPYVTKAVGDAAYATKSSIEGFAPYQSGVKSYVASTELGTVQTTAAAPAGEKATVLAETWGKPGVLHQVWTANSGADATKAAFTERGGRIRIYADNSTTPVVNLSLGEFFGFIGRGGVYSTPRVGRTARDDVRSSAYRYLNIPFQDYMRVEIVNTTATEATAFYGQVAYTLGDTIGQLKSYSIQSKSQSVAKYDRLEVANFTGAGQLESLFVALEGADEGDYGALEANVEIYLDGETYPSWRSPGTEDAFNGGWYLVPVGGYPAGRAGLSDLPNLNTQYYRFFTDDPVFFTNGARVVIGNGQRGQGSIVSPNVTVSAHVGAWSTTPRTVSRPLTGTSILNEVFSNGLTGWSVAGDKAAASVVGGVLQLPWGNDDPHRDIRFGKSIVQTSFFAVGKVRITDATHDDQQVFILAQGASDPYFGSAVHVTLVRETQYKWMVRVQDDFNNIGTTQIDGGRDLTNVWVELGLRVVSGVATAFWRFEGATEWLPIARWTSSKTESTVGFGSWTAGAEIKSFQVQVVAPPA